MGEVNTGAVLGMLTPPKIQHVAFWAGIDLDGLSAEGLRFVIDYMAAEIDRAKVSHDRMLDMYVKEMAAMARVRSAKPTTEGN